MKKLKLKQSNQNQIIQQAVKTLNNSGMIVYPTETCYGIGVDATNKKAVAKLLKYKAKRGTKPLSIAVSDKQMATQYVEINEVAQNLYDNFLPGALTIVSKGLGKVASGVESEYNTLGIRIPDYPLIIKTIKKLGKPITATSANISYRKKPYSIEDLIKNTPAKNLKQIDLIIDAGKLPKRKTSTVVDTTLNSLIIMREGSIALKKDTYKQRPILEAQTFTDDETRKFGAMNMLKLIGKRKRPLVFLLSGELGTGKTQFAKGIASILKIKDTVKSPTYTILSEYDYDTKARKGQFVHIDTWRTQSFAELLEIGFENYLRPGNVIAIEWADKFYKEIIGTMGRYNCNVYNVVFKCLGETEREIKTYKLGK